MQASHGQRMASYLPRYRRWVSQTVTIKFVQLGRQIQLLARPAETL